MIRPHPVENHDVWREWAKPLNIEVRYEGSANNWMMAADAVVHPGCTTGMEGLLLDRAVFSYVPDADSEFIGEQDRASEWVTNAEELSNGLARVRGLDQQDVRQGFAPQRERLRNSIVNVEPPYAADRILDELEQLDVRPVRPAQVGVGSGFVAKLIRAGRRWLPQQAAAKRDERSLQKFPVSPRRRSARRLLNGPTPLSSPKCRKSPASMIGFGRCISHARQVQQA